MIYENSLLHLLHNWFCVLGRGEFSVGIHNNTFKTHPGSKTEWSACFHANDAVEMIALMVRHLSHNIRAASSNKSFPTPSQENVVSDKRRLT